MAKTTKAVTKKTKSSPKGSAAGKKPTPRTAGAKRAVAKSVASKTTIQADRRLGEDRRSAQDRRKKSQPIKVERRKIERRAKVNRRRQIDPTTCERDYSGEEIEFMNALDEYKRSSGRMFPTCSEILEVVKKLGYQKLPQPQLDDQPGPETETDGVRQHHGAD